MDQKIKKSYSNIKLTEESKEKIYQQILQTDEDGRLRENLIRRGRKSNWSSWKMGIAACLAAALLIPTGVYAAGKLSEYMTVTVGKNNYQTKIQVHKADNTQDASETPAAETENPDIQYIQVKADFGSDYQLYMTLDGTYTYTCKDDIKGGKTISYSVLYMDKDSDETLNLYSQDSLEEMKINGHRALFCKYLMAPKGSRYESDYDTYATLNLYVFYEEYGYIINYKVSPMLGKELLISLAEKTMVTKAAKKDASQYIFLSNYQGPDTIKGDGGSDKKEITLPVKGQNEIVEHSGITYQVTDVRVSSTVEDRDLAHFYLLDEPLKFGLWNKKGKLKSYIRENIKYGDGISEPESFVTGEEKIQPKMVYVTMKVKADHDTIFELPTIEFFEKEGQKYYDTQQYQQYNRPLWMELALVDFIPCYFKESRIEKKHYCLKKLRKGEEQEFHFAYIVDEDMTDTMYLRQYSADDSCPYIDISQ